MRESKAAPRPAVAKVASDTNACCTFIDGIEIRTRCSYDKAVSLLCEYEDKIKPAERYTIYGKDGRPMARRGIELVLSRLYSYERRDKRVITKGGLRSYDDLGAP